MGCTPSKTKSAPPHFQVTHVTCLTRLTPPPHTVSQVRELLKHKRFDQALDLITSSTTDPHSQPSTPGTSTPPSSSHRPSTPTPAAFDSPAAAAAAAVAAAAAAAASRGGPSWQQVALAQAGLLMLLEAEFETGLSVLQELPMEVWQPCQLFSLFPDLTGRWVGQWGHGCWYWSQCLRYVSFICNVIGEVRGLCTLCILSNRCCRRSACALPWPHWRLCLTAPPRS
jgi:hypothetical protein